MRLRFSRNISFKLPAMILVMVAAAVGLASSVAYFQQRQTLQDAAENRILRVAQARADEVKDLFAAISQDLGITARRSSTKRAIMGFQRAWRILEIDEIADLQRLYGAENSFDDDARRKLDSAGDASTWTTVHAQMHPEFRDLLELYGYGDIYLINSDGRVIYSVEKRADFGTDLTDSAAAQSGLSRVFDAAAGLPPGELAFEDFAPYQPAGGVQAAFVATPLFSTSGKPLGVLAYQISSTMVTNVVGRDEGLGATGNAYLVGPDRRLRSSAQDGQAGVSTTGAGNNPVVKRALAGETGVSGVDGEDGNAMLAAFVPVDVFGKKWALVAQEASSEILSSVSRLGKLLSWGALAAIAVTGLIGAFFAQSLTRPLWRVVSVMREIAKGNYMVKIPGTERGDEIGVIAGSLESIRERLERGRKETRENTFRGVAFEATSAAVMMADADMIITSINPALCAILDQHRSEFEKLYPDFDPQGTVGSEMDFYHPEPVREHIRDLLRDPENLPYVANISIGEARFSLRISMVCDDDGEQMGYVVEWEDVTREFLNTAILAAIDNSQVRAEFTSEGLFLGSNRNFADMMGEDLEKLDGKHGADIFRFSEKMAAERGAVFDRLERGEIISGLFELPLGNGRNAIIEGSFSPVVDANGKLLRILMLGNDVTEARLAIEAAEARREAMRLAQAEVVESLGQGLGRLAEGDLTARIDNAFSPEYEKLRADFNTTGERLLEAMRAVVDNADLIRGEASEIANAADDLSSRTERQAATLEETASALDQLTSSVGSAADGAGIANELVQAARENAEASGAVVREAVEAMSAIENSSLRISKITDVIDDIAFQTNLLALNAGVEAARAGDAGRGFAVVASEVRALAQRSSDAAREINELISQSGAQVKRGVKLVGQTGSALAAIVQNVTEINQKVSEIAVSSREQSSGLVEINEAVNQLDQVTQQNAAMFEETTAASHALTREAENLNETTSKFKIGILPGRSVPHEAADPRTQTATMSTHAALPDNQPAQIRESHENLAAEVRNEIEEDWDDF